MDATYLVGGIAVTPLVVGIVNEAKKAGVPSRFAGILAIGVGVAIYAAWSAASAATPTQWVLNLLTGIGSGLAASGLYSNVKNIRGS